MAYKRKQDQAKSSHEWYEKHKALVLRRKNARRKAAQVYIRSTKVKKKCLACRKAHRWYQLDYDHRPGTIKKYTISSMPSNNSSIAAIKLEIAKCRLVCSNCHRHNTFKGGK